MSLRSITGWYDFSFLYSRNRFFFIFYPHKTLKNMCLSNILTIDTENAHHCYLVNIKVKGVCECWVYSIILSSSGD